jgi:ABC-type glycerol-3-phosphate transport system substrate-binding protein
MIRRRKPRRSVLPRCWSQPEVQVAFNLKKGSLPIRGDVDLSAANDCMKKGLEILAGGNIVPSGDMVWSPDVQKQAEDLMVEFWKSDMPAGRCACQVGRNPEDRSLRLS